MNQQLLFPSTDLLPPVDDRTSSTFINNMKLPVHRWIRYSAGFSGAWAEAIIADSFRNTETRVLDPFAGSGTTLIAAENVGVESYGIEAHPFVFRLAKAKLCRRSSPEKYRDLIDHVCRDAEKLQPETTDYPTLINKCYDNHTLKQLNVLTQAVDRHADGSPTSELCWLTLVGILRISSHAGTAQWQYVLPRKSKKNPIAPFIAFRKLASIIYNDILFSQSVTGPQANIIKSDARTCSGIPDEYATLIVTSPPYPNNYDYADATRLEMSFFREIQSWGDLQESVRKYLIRSCSQHVPEKTVDLEAVLATTELDPIRKSISDICHELSRVRLTKGGRKTYHLMVACYFRDLAQVWNALRRVCASPSKICFVIGDSAPYGVYVPVMEWLGKLAIASGFKNFRFERTRDRNVKWKNRKHRVPLCEGRLWVEG